MINTTSTHSFQHMVFNTQFSTQSMNKQIGNIISIEGIPPEEISEMQKCYITFTYGAKITFTNTAITTIDCDAVINGHNVKLVLKPWLDTYDDEDPELDVWHELANESTYFNPPYEIYINGNQVMI